ncbi:hypothetical protein tinsulaeT_20270 [Thalassotalea insulae]|uniref:OmpA-like domain-containing protein n=1 Tax=Thalassotalea insulae TaxID=2056778 RepID=A0ABQ6GRZ4_9GAMM|nr:OmpA family protein [Thalassotalea insulae]GLX78687.1 hypothetical protein tinsulaeT_20270 [Thalassotalea insulae]
MKTSGDNVSTEAQQLAQLRSIIMGKGYSEVTDVVKKNARHIISAQISEALHDRQKSDQSINKVLQPLLEETVSHSVAHNKEKLVSALYPLMGSLIRKSVAAFLSDLMTRTNQLLESSFTLKGIKWRIQAWHAGISYAQYVAAQTFIYRVEHVFLIHKETGLLLNYVSQKSNKNTDADLISAMLTAINDFVSDSFLSDSDGAKQQLETITTNNFNLLIKPGPEALVVAAIIGTPSPQINEQLQITLEDIHRLYTEELTQFDGDDQPFAHTTSLLKDCLLAEQKTSAKHQHFPLYAWLFVATLTLLLVVKLTSIWQQKQLANTLALLSDEPGVVVKQLSVINSNEVIIDILRDPDAITINSWLQQHQLSIENLTIKQALYRSWEPQLLTKRASEILTRYPEVTSSWQDNQLNISGAVMFTRREKLLTELAIAGLSTEKNLNTNRLTLLKTPVNNNNQSINKQIFDDLVGQIAAIQLSFAVASAEIDAQMQQKINKLMHLFTQLNFQANKLNLKAGILIMGFSDSSGNREANEVLSRLRARNTANQLTQLGIARELIYVTGLGEIDINEVEAKSRKVLFNIIYVTNGKLAASK